MSFYLSPFAPENVVSRDRFGRAVPRQPAHSPHLLRAGLSSTESRSTVVYCVRTEFGRHYRYIANKGTGDDGMCCEFIAVLRVRDQEESTLS